MSTTTTAVRSKSLPCLFFFSFFFLLAFLPPAIEAADDELRILQSLKLALQKSNPKVFASWDTAVPKCNFAGITCNPDGDVAEIDLSGRNLSGVLPLDEICQLRSLEKLAFGLNSLNGRIYESLNDCVRLQYLDLAHNSYSGTFPDISSLNGLRYLHLNGSGISGAFPWKSLRNMTRSLEVFSLGDNPLDRSAFPEEITKLYKLNWLYLSNCSIEGAILPEIGNLTNLWNLELATNYLSGEIPAEIGKLASLWQLQLYENNFTGKLPIGIRNLTNLIYFDASHNNLVGDLSELRFLTNLVSLQLYENQLTGVVPEEFGDFRRLQKLSLYTNELTGPLPSRLGSWAKFDFIDVSENFLNGSIPPDMCKMGTMTKLLMIQNRFTGEIPATYASCSSLVRFRVNQNLLSGTVPAGIWGLPNAVIIDLRSNQFEGSIRPDIAKAKSLAQLFATSNLFSGELPAEIVQASSLIEIDLSNNRFSGEIPTNFGELKRLGNLDLENNEFSGSIPESLGSCRSLSSISIAHNSLSGEIPASLGNFPSLNALNLSGNRISGEIPSTLSALGLSLLDLSNNRLHGPIPQSLAIDAYKGSFVGNAGLCSNTWSKFRRCESNRRMSKEYRALIAGFVAALAVLLLLLAVLVRSRRGGHRSRKRERERSLRDESWDVKSFHVLSFTEDEILDAVKQENLIGKGGSGEVYKVDLSNGVDLAVKHIRNHRPGDDRSSAPMLRAVKAAGKSKEFEAEVRALSSVRHMNVVKLYCSITSEDSSLLVYEYLPNGSLWDRLHTREKKVELDWSTRYEIAVGAAKGLEYLHHGFDRPVIHRDVKSSNILLDQFFKPRISDFGLSKIVQAHIGKDSTAVIAGTPGYFAPEYGYSHKVDEKCDVYSFGVVLMELVTGKRPLEPEFGESKNIVSWVYGELRNRESVMGLVDPAVSPKEAAALEVLRISILCTARLPDQRPTMRVVVKLLEEAGPRGSVLGIDVAAAGEHGARKESRESRHSRSQTSILPEKL